MTDAVSGADAPGEAPAPAEHASGSPEATSRRTPGARGPTAGAGTLDGVTAFFGMRWDDPQTIRLQVRPELINAGGLLSGVATYALVDYCMGSTLWAQTNRGERIATISISINYIQTATEGEVVCRTVLDRRNRTTAVLRSEVFADDGRLLCTAIGSYAIFAKRPRAGVQEGSPPAQRDPRPAQR